jgi:hypothetical protein
VWAQVRKKGHKGGGPNSRYTKGYQTSKKRLLTFVVFCGCVTCPCTTGTRPGQRIWSYPETAIRRAHQVRVGDGPLRWRRIRKSLRRVQAVSVGSLRRDLLLGAYLCACLYGISPAQTYGGYTIVGNPGAETTFVINAAKNGDPRFGASYQSVDTRGYAVAVDDLGLVYLGGDFDQTLTTPPLADLVALNNGVGAFIFTIAGGAGGMNPLEVRGAGKDDDHRPWDHVILFPSYLPTFQTYSNARRSSLSRSRTGLVANMRLPCTRTGAWSRRRIRRYVFDNSFFFPVLFVGCFLIRKAMHAP